MRTQFPTDLEQDEIYQYVEYLGVVGGIFVIVALFLYITLIAIVIASKKWKRFSSERILKYHELHRRKGHIIFIVITILVFFLVLEAVIFGLVENSRLHHNVIEIAVKPTTVLEPAAQVVRNVNKTVKDTGVALDDSIVLIERVLVSVEGIEYSIDYLYGALLDVRNQFDAIEQRFQQAQSTLNDAQDHINNLNTYQDQGYISGVPDPGQVQTVNNTIETTITTATDYLNDTIDTIGNVLTTVNSTIANAVSTGNREVNQAKGTLQSEIASLQHTLERAVNALRSPNNTITNISTISTHYATIVYKILVAVFVMALIPLILVFVGLIAKNPLTYKFAFAASFVCMFWLIAIGGIFAVVHTAFSQVCDSREVIVINAIQKFTPDYYFIDLGDINIGPNSTGGDTTVYINMDNSTLSSLLNCQNPTNVFDVFDLESLIDQVFGQIYAALDQLQQEQARFFNSNTTSSYLNVNLNSQISSSTSNITSFANATQDLVHGSYLNNFFDMRGNMDNITVQASNLSMQANDTVNDALSGVNDITSNITTTSGDQYTYLYTLANVSDLNINDYPFNETTQKFQQNLENAQTTLQSALDNQGNIEQKVTAIISSTSGIIGDIEDFQDMLNSLNITFNVNSTIQGIQNQLNNISALIPLIYKNITGAIDSVRDVLGTVSNDLRTDTQCGFAGDFFTQFSADFCKTGKQRAQAMCAALLIMGISYFFMCILGVGLLKRHDVHRLMLVTEKGLQKIASIRVINRTLSMVNTLVRSTSEIFRGTSSRNLNVKDLNAQPSSPGTVVSDDEGDYALSNKTTSVKFSEVPHVAGEDPPPAGSIRRNESLSHITSALRNTTQVHQHTLSDNRDLAQAQEIQMDNIKASTGSGYEEVPSSPSISETTSPNINNSIDFTSSNEINSSETTSTANSRSQLIEKEDQE